MLQKSFISSYKVSIFQSAKQPISKGPQCSKCKDSNHIQQIFKRYEVMNLNYYTENDI